MPSVHANRKLHTRPWCHWCIFSLVTQLLVQGQLVVSSFVISGWDRRNLSPDLRRYLETILDHEKPISSRCQREEKNISSKIYPDLNLLALCAINVQRMNCDKTTTGKAPACLYFLLWLTPCSLAMQGWWTWDAVCVCVMAMMSHSHIILQAIFCVILFNCLLHTSS